MGIMELVWKKKVNYPQTFFHPSVEFSGPLTLSPLWNFQSLRKGEEGYAYFLEPHIVKICALYFTFRIQTTVIAMITSVLNKVMDY